MLDHQVSLFERWMDSSISMTAEKRRVNQTEKRRFNQTTSREVGVGFILLSEMGKDGNGSQKIVGVVAH